MSLESSPKASGTAIAIRGAEQSGSNSNRCSSSHAPAQAGVPVLADVDDTRFA
jgi:hypothetical protein